MISVFTMMSARAVHAQSRARAQSENVWKIAQAANGQTNLAAQFHDCVVDYYGDIV